MSAVYHMIFLGTQPTSGTIRRLKVPPIYARHTDVDTGSTKTIRGLYQAHIGAVATGSTLQGKANGEAGDRLDNDRRTYSSCQSTRSTANIESIVLRQLLRLLLIQGRHTDPISFKVLARRTKVSFRCIATH